MERKFLQTLAHAYIKSHLQKVKNFLITLNKNIPSHIVLPLSNVITKEVVWAIKNQALGIL